MAELSITSPHLAQTLKRLLSQITAASGRLDAGCTSTLRESNLKTALRVMQPLYDIALKLQSSKSLKLDKALVFLRDLGCCEMLLSLLRRMPWALMKHEGQRALLQSGLDLVPVLLRSMQPSLCVALCVRSSQQEAAYAAMSERCLSHLRRPGSACLLPSRKLVSASSFLLCQCLHSTYVPP